MSDFEIDDEIQAFIDQSNRFYQDSPQVHDQSQTMGPSRMRDDYNRMCQAFHCPYPEGITASDSHIDHDNYAIPVRYYDNPETPNHTAVIYYHGGGFILGGLESHDSICAEICANSNLTVVAVDYRLAPEYKHPVQFMDALRSFEYLSEKFSSLILVGDSAGGNLAAAVCGATRKRNGPMHPCSPPQTFRFIDPYGAKMPLLSWTQHLAHSWQRSFLDCHPAMLSQQTPTL